MVLKFAKRFLTCRIAYTIIHHVLDSTYKEAFFSPYGLPLLVSGNDTFLEIFFSPKHALDSQYLKQYHEIGKNYSIQIQTFSGYGCKHIHHKDISQEKIIYAYRYVVNLSEYINLNKTMKTY